MHCVLVFPLSKWDCFKSSTHDELGNYVEENSNHDSKSFGFRLVLKLV